MFKLFAATVTSVAVIVSLVVWAVNTHGSEVPVFDGVSAQQLAQAGVTLTEERPADHPSISRDDATRSLVSQSGVTLKSAELVRIDVAPGESIPPRPSGDHLVWAVRLDTTGVDATAEYFGTGVWFSHSDQPTIAFVDAATGDYIARYQLPAAAKLLTNS